MICAIVGGPPHCNHAMDGNTKHKMPNMKTQHSRDNKVCVRHDSPSEGLHFLLAFRPASVAINLSPRQLVVAINESAVLTVTHPKHITSNIFGDLRKLSNKELKTFRRLAVRTRNISLAKACNSEWESRIAWDDAMNSGRDDL